MSTLFTCITLLLATLSAHAVEYVPDYDRSEVTFSGSHAGSDFDGRFEQWQATIVISPQNSEQNRINATFQLASAKTGNKLYDGTLPENDWFYVERFPEATFSSTSIEEMSKGRYVVTGKLTIRDKSQPIDFELLVSPTAADLTSITGEFIIDRLAFGIGVDSDPDAEWVSQEIAITLDISARR